MVLVCLLGAYRMGHRSIGARGSVLLSGLALLLLLLEKIMLPVKLLPLRVHVVEVSGSK